MRTKRRATIVLFLAVSAAISVSLPAQDSPGWVGTRVVPKTKMITLLVNGEAMERGGEGVEFYRVEQVDGNTLLLRSEAHRVNGWAERDQVVLIEQAVEFFNQQIRTHPATAYFHAARALLSCDKKAYASALRDYDESIRLEPKDAAHHCGRARVWTLTNEYDKAIDDFSAAIKLDAKSAQAFLGRGAARAGKREYTRAIDDDSEAIWLDPLAIDGYNNRGLAWFAKKEFAKAIVDFTTALRLDSRHVQSYCERGDAWAGLGRFDKALNDFDQAIQIDEKCARAYGTRAWLWSTCPSASYRDGKKAVVSATHACVLTDWNDLLALDALAAALAETGDFESALKWQTRANALRHSDAEKSLGEARIKSFQQQKPWRTLAN